MIYMIGNNTKIEFEDKIVETLIKTRFGNEKVSNRALPGRMANLVW